LRISENKALRRIFGPKREKLERMKKNYTRSFIIDILHLMLLPLIKSRGLRWAGHVALTSELMRVYAV
jgi:hypothetical protein